MTRRLEGKVALITGAGSVGPGWGNGRAAAVLFAREGARIVAVDRDRSSVDETARLIEQEQGQVEVLEADVTDLASVKAMADAAVKRFGRVDVLLNNVGGSIPGGPEEMSVEDFKGQIDLNLTSVFITAKVILPLMAKQKAGAVVNVGSIGGMRHLGHDHVGYTAGKSALIQFTRHIAVRYAKDGIRCNTVIPGMIDTPLLEVRVAKQKGRKSLDELREEAKTKVPLGKRGEAWDVAYAALFLASDEAKYVTGTEILVDGGLMARSA